MLSEEYGLREFRDTFSGRSHREDSGTTMAYRSTSMSFRAEPLRFLTIHEWRRAGAVCVAVSTEPDLNRRWKMGCTICHALVDNVRN